MPIAQRFDPSQRADQVPLGRLFSDCQQGIRSPTESRDDDDWLSCDATLHNRGGALDRLRIAHRGPAELAADHAVLKAPFAASSSAFKTDPPAAPRTVLWPSATM